MRTFKRMTTAAFLSLCIISCQKKNDPIAAEGIAKSNTDSTGNLKLQSFTKDGRTYNFHYDQQGYIDSVVAVGPGSVNYTYRVSHHGRFIDSSSLWQNDQLVSSRKNVQYDLIGRVTGFDYQIHVYPAPARTYLFDYTSQGDVYSMEILDQSPKKDTFGYSANHDLTLLHSTVFGGNTVTSFTNDSTQNPLSLINAAVIFTEEGFYDLWFNGSNVTQAVQHTGQPGTTNYVNQYDAQGRITSSTGTGAQPRIITFTYL